MQFLATTESILVGEGPIVNRGDTPCIYRLLQYVAFLSSLFRLGKFSCQFFHTKSKKFAIL